MRELKFRCWDKRHKTMSEPLSLEWCLTSDGDWSVWEKCIFMQFTGLSDKNGNEIYEGDVIRESRGECHRDTVVEYPMYDPSWKDYFEIIGNIYEHKELLKVEK